MLTTIRRYRKVVSVFLLLDFLIVPLYNAAWALTSGPAQPETQQFVPATVDNLVDPFTGDFSYNIPLMKVGDYPINLNYASGIAPDAEATWVGLGWNLNVGAVNRSVRGLPDDFAGDPIKKDFNIKPSQTYGFSYRKNFEIFGEKTSVLTGKAEGTLNVFYNNYTGAGISLGVAPSVSAGLGSQRNYTAELGLGATLSSESGVEVTPKFGLGYKQSSGDAESTLGASISQPFSTREGLKHMTLNTRISSENEGYKFNYSRGASFQGFSVPTYTPVLEHNMYNINAALNFDYEVTNPATENSAIAFGGYYSGQFLKSTSRTSPAYGYMYSGLSESDDKVLDFNREKDAGVFNKFTTNLPVTNFTYDIFNVSGQGIGGTYRLYRGDVGAVHDPATDDDGYDPSLGLEIGTGPTPSVKVGVDATYNHTESYSGPWKSSSIKHFNKETDLNKPGQEAAYFKKVGELAPETDNRFFQDIQVSYSPLRHAIFEESAGADGGLTGDYIIPPLVPGGASGTKKIEADNLRTQRRLRESAFTTLNVKEAKTGAILPIYSYEQNNFDWYGKGMRDISWVTQGAGGYTKKTPVGRDGNGRKSDHISEVRVTDDNGARYVYGVPVYNTYQEDVTFACPGTTANAASGLVAYTPGNEDTENNDKGQDNYFNRVTTPPFAYSYLLSCILSADYVDRDGIPGPSEGDLGDYTKFNYTKLTEPYNWRTPYAIPDASTGKSYASFTQGMIGKNPDGTDNKNELDKDDKANYIFGTKEVWYLHSIETRTHAAEFYLEDRDDGLGVDGNRGGMNTAVRLKRLKEIKLYSRPDKWNSDPVAIKTVHFDYDYSLCPGTPNSIATTTLYKGKPEEITISGGKLTLKKVWFTYGKSEKGVLNPYVFNYADQDFNGVMDKGLNPDYNFQKYDRWKVYKDRNSNGMTNADYPYSVSDKATADLNAAVYALSSINTPTGGSIRAYYESDDYAYVQNRQAMRMFNIVGTASSENAMPGTTDLYNHNCLIVDLAEGFTPKNDANRDDEFRQRYLKGIDLLYFKARLKIVNKTDHSENVPGYAPIDVLNSKLVPGSKNGNTYKYAVIALKFVDENGVPDDDNKSLVNPLSRTGWMFARLHANRELMGAPDNTSNSLKQLLQSLRSLVTDVVDLFKSFTGKMTGAGNSQTFDVSNSFVRLNEPDKIKLGGGHRVKAIVLSDNWSQMKSAKEMSGNLADKETSYYGQLYDYTYQENGETISAGVASYEPFMGGEENPFRMPVFVREEAPLAPSKEYFLEEPFGESFFPDAVVGYRQVVVKPLRITKADLDARVFKGNGTGKVVHEFYTSYDFPTITKRTDLFTARHNPNILMEFMKFDVTDLVTCTQGYYVELNDMHGKPKAQRVYSEPGVDAQGKIISGSEKAISEVEYFYKRNDDGTLNNSVTYVKPDLSVLSADVAPPLGVEVDVVHDERFFQSSSIGGGAQVNFKYFAIGPIPVFTATAFPDFSSSETRFRSLVTTKVVNRYGILEKTTAKDNGAAITTTNLAWDQSTGKVLLTSVDNEYHDKVYNFSYPGYWAYGRMDLASLNEGMRFTGDAATNDPIVKSFVRDGDEVVYWPALGGDPKIAYCSVAGTQVTFMDADGNTSFNPAAINNAKVLRSGGRNLSALSAGSISCLDDPISGKSKLSFSRVLNASAMEYNENWGFFCGCYAPPQIGTRDGVPSMLGNPNTRGEKGIIRPWRSSAYLTGRVQTRLNNNLDLRNDGYYSDFAEYWQYNPADKRVVPPVSLASTKWQVATEIVNYNKQGKMIEDRDALNRYSMAQYGYGANLPVAIATNSRYQESGFEGFEDNEFEDCDKVEFSINYLAPLTREEAHTGRVSLIVTKDKPYHESIHFSSTASDSNSTSDGPGCVPYFGLLPSKKYWISAWVKEKHTGKQPAVYTSAGIKISFDQGVTSTTLRASGPLVDGWQKIEGYVTTPASVSDFRVDLLADNAPAGVYYDDIRIHPFDANMKSYVYDPFTFKLTAELDENNFATRYEYDDEGILIRVKKETERGLMTITENRMNQSKINK